MGKIFTSLGLMSGTSGDGVDASIIKSDGNLESNKEVIIEIIKDKFFEYDNTIVKKIHSIRNKINFLNDLKKYSSEIADLEREITLFHAKTSNEMMKNKMEGNLNPELSNYIDTTLNNLKINYLEESKKDNGKEDSDDSKTENNSQDNNEKEDLNEGK